jgi:hypothetical protein
MYRPARKEEELRCYFAFDILKLRYIVSGNANRMGDPPAVQSLRLWHTAGLPKRVDLERKIVYDKNYSYDNRIRAFIGVSKQC